MILYRPVNQAELNLVIQSGWQAFPPRLESQPIFYPVLNETYAEQITIEWNVPSYGVGHVLKFEVEDAFLKKYDVQRVGADHHLEYWIPADELDLFNDNIVGQIELISTYK
ncbi:MAG: hypothetical protein AAFO07_24955 [Bacteroidota bacterium]